MMGMLSVLLASYRDQLSLQGFFQMYKGVLGALGRAHSGMDCHWKIFVLATPESWT